MNPNVNATFDIDVDGFVSIATILRRSAPNVTPAYAVNDSVKGGVHVDVQVNVDVV